MKATSIFAATISGAVVLFLLGYIFQIVTLSDMDLSIKSIGQIERDSIVYPALIIKEIVYAFLMAFIFYKWAGITKFSAGLKAGAVIGLLISLGVGLGYYATTYLLSIKGVLINVVTVTIQFALAGGVIAFIIGRRPTVPKR